jgi:hypothetical protein
MEWKSKLGNVFPKAEIERLHRDHIAQLKRLRKAPGNVGCADCGASENSWASVNLGCFLCVDCASVHRGLGTHITKCKNTTGTYLWGPDEISMMETKGNARVNAEFLASPTAPSKAAPEEDRRAFLHRKYAKREWAAPVAEPAAPQGAAAQPSLVPMVPCARATPPLAFSPPKQPVVRAPLPAEPAPAFPTLPVPQREAFRARRLTSEEAAQTADLFALFAESPSRSCRSTERSPLISFGNYGDDWLEGW